MHDANDQIVVFVSNSEAVISLVFEIGEKLKAKNEQEPLNYSQTGTLIQYDKPLIYEAKLVFLSF